MREFLRLVFALALAMILVVLAVGGIAYWEWGRGPEIKKETILVQSMVGPIPEYPPGGFTSGLFASDQTTLHTVLGNLEKAAVDDRIAGVLVLLGSPGTGYASLEEIRAALERVRAAGKPVYAWADHVNLKDLYVAAACDSFFLDPITYVELAGMYAERMYLADMFRKLGVEPNLTRIESYKSAAEMVIRTDMSPQTREMVGWILGDLYPHVMAGTAEGLGVGEDVLLAAMELVQMPADDLAELGLADRVLHWDEMKDALPRPKGKERPRLVHGEEYQEVDPGDVGLGGKKKIAVVHAQGLIAGSQSGQDPFLGQVMGYQSVNADLQSALDDEDVVAVVFRIDSGGGETLVGNRIGRMVEVVDETKPVVVSMADVAASGGYEIAYRARRLFADGNTITGSIGSITGKINLRGFYNKLGITKDGMGMGPHAGFYTDYRNWTPEEMDLVKEDHWAGYDHWITDIATHRGMTVAEVDSLARGRVWTGRQAVENGLIDALGGLDAAVAEAKELAGLDAGEKVGLVHYPQPEGFLSTLLGTEVSAVPEVVVGRWFQDRAATMQGLGEGELRVLTVPVP